MSEKLSLADLVDFLSQKTGKSKKEAEAFLKEFFSLVGSVVSNGESLKINDLGTFKSTWVKPRVSVNVRTGESIEIAGHYKLSFIPDKTLRDAVNTPFANFETVILKEGYSDDTEVAVADDANEFSGSEDDDETQLTDVEEADEKNESEQAGEVIADQNAEIQEPLKNEKIKEVEPVSQNKELPEPTYKNDDNILTLEERKKIRSGRHKMILLQSIALGLLFCCLILVGGVIYDIYKHQGILSEFFAPDKDPYLDIIDDVPEVKPTSTEHVTLPESQKIVTTDTIAVVPEKQLEVKSEIKKDSVPAEKKAVVSESDDSAKKEVLKPGVEEITPGKTLAQLARTYYGNTSFWVYIYIENMSKIPNPNHVAIGTKIVIPDAKKYNIDAKNKESVAKAKSMASEVLANFQ